MRSFAGRDILSLKDFERNDFFHVFDVAAELEPIAVERRNSDLLAEKTLVTAFYQPSTRTRLAHEAAMHRLGGHVTGFSDAKMTRAGDFYQESIKDTVKMLEYYGDVIVMRHFQQGAPHEAAVELEAPSAQRPDPEAGIHAHAAAVGRMVREDHGAGGQPGELPDDAVQERRHWRCSSGCARSTGRRGRYG